VCTELLSSTPDPLRRHTVHPYHVVTVSQADTLPSSELEVFTRNCDQHTVKLIEIN